MSCTNKDSFSMAFRAAAFSRRRCWTVAVGDPTEVHETIDRLGNLPADDASAMRDIWVRGAHCCWPVRAPTRPRTATIGIDTAQCEIAEV
jgi:hypothetical protein